MKPRKPRVATLRIEPHFIPPDELQDYDGPPEGMLAYRVFQNSKQIAKEAHPIGVTDDLVARRINRKAPWYDYSGAYWKVRRVLNTVVWFGELIAYHFATEKTRFAYGKIRPPLHYRWIKFFDAEQYRQALDAAYHNYQDAWKHVVYPDDYTRHDRLPEISPLELHSVTQGFVPLHAEELFVSRDPPAASDPRGRAFYRKVYHALQEHLGLEVCEQPERYTEVRFGRVDYSKGYQQLDDRLWLVGMTDAGVAVQFPQGRNSKFPFWVRGEAFDVAFAGERFL